MTAPEFHSPTQASSNKKIYILSSKVIGGARREPFVCCYCRGSNFISVVGILKRKGIVLDPPPGRRQSYPTRAKCLAGTSYFTLCVAPFCFFDCLALSKFFAEALSLWTKRFDVCLLITAFSELSHLPRALELKRFLMSFAVLPGKTHREISHQREPKNFCDIRKVVAESDLERNIMFILETRDARERVGFHSP